MRGKFFKFVKRNDICSFVLAQLRKMHTIIMQSIAWERAKPIYKIYLSINH